MPPDIQCSMSCKQWYSKTNELSIHSQYVIRSLSIGQLPWCRRCSKQQNKTRVPIDNACHTWALLCSGVSKIVDVYSALFFSLTIPSFLFSVSPPIRVLGASLGSAVGSWHSPGSYWFLLVSAHSAVRNGSLVTAALRGLQMTILL